MSYALIFKFELFFAFPFGTILYRKADYFSVHRIGDKYEQGCNRKYALQRNGKEDFPVTNVSGTYRDWQPTIEPRRNNNQALGMECVRGTVVRS